MDTFQDLYQRRDAKAVSHLEQYAPVWIVDEKVIPQDEAIQFNVVFQHPQYGWVNRRYRYDGFNNVLYHKGQILTNEMQLAAIQDRDPYIAVSVNDVPNAYGG